VVTGMTAEEKAVWARSYNSAYKRAWNASANAYKLERRRALRGDAVESSSSALLAPKEVATVAARQELSRFRGAVLPRRPKTGEFLSGGAARPPPVRAGGRFARHHPYRPS